MQKTKICRVCLKRKRLDQFYKNKARPDGLQTRCKGCNNYYYQKREFKPTYTYECWKCKEEYSSHECKPMPHGVREDGTECFIINKPKSKNY